MLCLTTVTCLKSARFLFLQTRRIIIFIVGGVTHSEVRVAHQLSKKLQRDVLLGGTSIDNPATFLGKLHHLSSSDVQHHD